ncbi:C40 family peptidase [Anaerococcus nagyae]|uniref:C40 family peptidase n=1 Tax=Anaerococcus nagyae TaxID=1755241 RepID=UPI001AEAC874|nr:C40 family peptidase [Anaerococcus nagyae]MBP2070259.1 cell wall-associated NlpC family hydrolase [Anaerococcus nagyae]
MDKKKIGAALSVVAAVTAGATAYASTINNLDADKNTNSMIQPNYADKSYDYYSLVKADYTNDLKNTAIANETRTVQNTKETEEEVANIEKNAKSILATNITVAKEKDSNEEVSDNEEKEVEVQKETIDNSKTDDATPIKEELEVTNSEKNADDIKKESTEESKPEEESTDQEKEELDDGVELAESTNNSNSKSEEDELIEYNNKDLDSNESEDDNDIEEVAYSTDSINYLDNNSEVIESKKNENTSEDKVKENKVIQAVKYVNVEALNLRNSKSMDNNSNVIKTLLAGNKVTGAIEGDWLKTNDGYLKLSYLSDNYPQSLVDQVSAKQKEENAKIKAEEAKKDQEAKKAQEAKVAKEQKVKKEKNNENVQKNQEAKQEEKGQAFTGWVYNTNALNVRDKALNGKILGALTKGTKVSGEILNGWVKFDYKGKTAYTSAAYLSTTEVASQPEVKENTQNNQNPQQSSDSEEVVDEQEVAVEKKQSTPVANVNGQQAANIASGFAGSPYVWGSSNPSVGFDCSGLVKYVYQQLGVNLPHSSGAQFNSGYSVNINSLQPGDIVFFSNRGSLDHVGIVVSSDGTFIHASTPKSGVKYDNVYSSYYQKVFSGARRIF